MDVQTGLQGFGKLSLTEELIKELTLTDSWMFKLAYRASINSA
jgi:hypothetical protein